MNRRFKSYSVLVGVVVGLFMMLTFTPSSSALVSAQGLQQIVELEVEAGFGADAYYRPNMWLPLRVTIANNGSALTGNLLVRPETSGDALINTFSTPVDLPAGSNQVLFLYISADNTNRPLRVELLNEENRVISDKDVSLTNLQTRQRLYVVVTGATAGSVIDLRAVHTGGNEAFQANWNLENIPDRAPALDAIDVMVFNDIDTATLSPAQRGAITQWVNTGGHLIVTGGTAWEGTAEAFESLLPLIPTDRDILDNSTPISELGGDYRAELVGQFSIATGELTDDALILAQTADDIPLVARRPHGNGSVSYLAFDPNEQPFQSWTNRIDLWWTLLSSVDVHPSWTNGFADWDRAQTASEILPGLDLLPPILTLLGFLLGYIVLVGPVNYAILSYINRRDWAWITIPILIVIFSIVARAIGVDLRGNKATLSRISVVQSWADNDTAQVDQLIGLLAPRRGTYSLGVEDDRLLRPLPTDGSSSGIGANTLVNVNIEQTTTFEATEFPIDASFIANFTASGVTPAPDISGQVTLVYGRDENSEFETIQGAVRNDTDFTLFEPTILARGLTFQLGDELESGDIRTFEGLRLTREASSPSSPLEVSTGDDNPFLVTTSSSFFNTNTDYERRSNDSVIDIMAGDFENAGIRISFDDDAETQTRQRKQAFLQSFIIDQFGSTSRGNRVYLVGWGEDAPLDEVIGGADWTALDTTLYVIELNVAVDNPNRRVLVSRDQFSWVATQRDGASAVGAYAIGLFGASELTYRFTPLPSAILSEVEELTVILDRTNPTSSLVEMAIWNWREHEWDTLNMFNVQEVTLDDSNNLALYLGPLNTVQLRVRRPDTGGSARINQIAIEQLGQF